jgi:hypothetical protein
VSAAYRRNFHPFASPWRVTRSPLERLRAGRDAATVAEQRRERVASYYTERAMFYPTGQASLRL